MSKKFLPLYISAKIIKIDRDFPKLWSQMYCHLFYGSQCTCVHSALELSGRCALQIYLLTYLLTFLGGKDRLQTACWLARRRSGRHRRTSATCWHLSPVSSHWALSAQPPTATTSYSVPVVSLARALSQLQHLELGSGCSMSWKRQPVLLTVLNVP